MHSVEVITLTPYLQIAEDNDYRTTIACGALQEIAQLDSEFKSLQKHVSFLKDDGGVQRVPFDRLVFQEGLTPTVSIAANINLIAGIKYDQGGLRYIYVETMLGKILTVLDVAVWNETVIRRNRIDLVPGGFIRMLRTIREYHRLLDTTSAKADFHAVYPHFDFDEFTNSELERAKRIGFVRSLLGYLTAGNPRPEKGRINDLIKLCRTLQDITVNFETVDGRNTIAVEIHPVSEMPRVNFPRGVLACNVRDHHVNDELNAARDALKNHPLI